MNARPDPAGELPSPDNVLLVVEVSDTTLDYDRKVKLPRYGRSGVPEAWIVDLASRLVEIYSEPFAEGYRKSRVVGAGEQISAATIENLELTAEEIFG